MLLCLAKQNINKNTMTILMASALYYRFCSMDSWIGFDVDSESIICTFTWACIGWAYKVVEAWLLLSVQLQFGLLNTPVWTWVELTSYIHLKLLWHQLVESSCKNGWNVLRKCLASFVFRGHWVLYFVP